MKNIQVKQRLLKLYEEHENGTISKNDIFNFVRDFYYYEIVGKSYEDFLSTRKKEKK